MRVMCVDAHRGQMRLSKSLELELWDVVSHRKWVLELNLGPLGAISPAQFFVVVLFCCLLL